MSAKVKETSTEPKSLQDAGYRFAQQAGGLVETARYVYGQCPDFVNNVPDEVKTALYAGFQLRKHELTGDKYYKLAEGGTYIPLDKKPADDVQGIVCMTINVAMSYSQQEFGKMKSTDPAKHAIVKPLRDAFSDFAGNNMRDLKARIKSIVNAGKPRERAPNDDFNVALKKAFDGFDKRAKTAKDRGDASADPVKFRLAVDAFWNTYNK
jgi:hypothetical protein